MSKRNKSDYLKYLERLIKIYTPILNLGQFTFKLQNKVENSSAIMECVFCYPYLNARINYSDASFEKWKKGEDVVTYLVHEMCHLLTDPLYSKALDRCVSKGEIEDERERLTDWISNTIIKHVDVSK